MSLYYTTYDMCGFMLSLVNAYTAQALTTNRPDFINTFLNLRKNAYHQGNQYEMCSNEKSIQTFKIEKIKNNISF